MGKGARSLQTGSSRFSQKYRWNKAKKLSSFFLDRPWLKYRPQVFNRIQTSRRRRRCCGGSRLVGWSPTQPKRISEKSVLKITLESTNRYCKNNSSNLFSVNNQTVVDRIPDHQPFLRFLLLLSIVQISAQVTNRNNIFLPVTI